MNLEIHALGFEMTPALHQHILHRSRFAFSQFSEHELYIRITLFDSNVPRGGEDKYTHIYLGAPGVKKTIIKEQQSDLYRAIDRAINRAQRALSRKFSLQRALSRKASAVIPVMNRKPEQPIADF